MSTPDSPRTVQIITRGEYAKIVREAEEDQGTQPRKYLVATDLSDESTHALEWAIGTVLRDGDTLLAIYCVDEETSILTTDSSLIPDDPKLMKEQAALINVVTNSKATTPPAAPTSTVPYRPSPLGQGEDSSISPSPAPLES